VDVADVQVADLDEPEEVVGGVGVEVVVRGLAGLCAGQGLWSGWWLERGEDKHSCED